MASESGLEEIFSAVSSSSNEQPVLALPKPVLSDKDMLLCARGYTEEIQKLCNFPGFGRVDGAPVRRVGKKGLRFAFRVRADSTHINYNSNRGDAGKLTRFVYKYEPEINASLQKRLDEKNVKLRQLVCSKQRLVNKLSLVVTKISEQLEQIRLADANLSGLNWAGGAFLFPCSGEWFEIKARAYNAVLKLQYEQNDLLLQIKLIDDEIKPYQRWRSYIMAIKNANFHVNSVVYCSATREMMIVFS